MTAASSRRKTCYTSSDSRISAVREAPFMTVANLKGIADQVVRRARRQGISCRARCERMNRPGRPMNCGRTWWPWPAVAELPPRSLLLQRPRQRPRPPRAVPAAGHPAGRRSARPRQPAASATPVERRGQDRVDFVQTVAVRTEDGEEFTLLSRDLSATGIRLVGTRGCSARRSTSSSPGRTANHPTTSGCASCGPATSATACSRAARVPRSGRREGRPYRGCAWRLHQVANRLVRPGPDVLAVPGEGGGQRPRREAAAVQRPARSASHTTTWPSSPADTSRRPSGLKPTDRPPRRRRRCTPSPPGCQVPAPQGLVAGARQQRRSVRRKRHAVDRVAVPVQRPFFLAV